MPSRRTYQVKEVADISGVSVRALHHYDSIRSTIRSSIAYKISAQRTKSYSAAVRANANRAPLSAS